MSQRRKVEPSAANRLLRDQAEEQVTRSSSPKPILQVVSALYMNKTSVRGLFFWYISQTSLKKRRRPLLIVSILKIWRPGAEHMKHQTLLVAGPVSMYLGTPAGFVVTPTRPSTVRRTIGIRCVGTGMAQRARELRAGNESLPMTGTRSKHQ